jgi:3-(3-hydroxy-phenyl)propionate hydroxylase
MLDAPLQDKSGNNVYLTEVFARGGRGFTLLQYANGTATQWPADVARIVIGNGAEGLRDPTGAFAKRYDCAPGTAYLLRPDGYVAARFKQAQTAAIADALRRANGWQ